MIIPGFVISLFILGLVTLFFSLGSVSVAYGQTVDPYTGAACQQIYYTCTTGFITDEFGCRAQQTICQTTCGTTETNIFRDTSCVNQALQRQGCSITNCTQTRLCSASCTCTGTNEYLCSTSCGTTFIRNEGCVGAPACLPGQIQLCFAPTPTPIAPPPVVGGVGGGGGRNQSNQANFGLGSLGSPWFQSESGDIYVGNTLTDSIPGTALEKYMSLRLDTTRPPFPGVAIQGSNTSVTMGEGGVSAVGWLALNSPYPELNKYDYAYFANKLTISGTMPACKERAVVEAAEVSSGTTVCYKGTDVSLSGDITMTGNKSSVVFIDGNLTLNHTTSIPSGSFLAFIVNGTITVDPTTGQTIPSSSPGTAVPDLHGIFIANQFKSSNTTGVQKQLILKGSVISWGDIELNRRLADNTIPAHYFIYDPALVLAIPQLMQRSIILWQQVPP